MSLSDTETNCIGESLSERTSRDLDTISVSSFGVAWGKRIELTELLQVVQGKLEAEKKVKEAEAAAAKDNKSVAITA